MKSDESHETMVKQITGHTLLAVIVSVSVLSSVLMSAIISLVIWRLKRPNRAITRSSSPEQQQQTSNKATTLRTANTYCFNEDARLSHLYSSPIEISASQTDPEWHCEVFKRKRASREKFNVNICASEQNLCLCIFLDFVEVKKEKSVFVIWPVMLH